MSTFLLTLDLADHAHGHSPMAQRHIVGQLLDQAKQNIGSGLAKEGEITRRQPSGKKVIGSWTFIEADGK